MVNDQWNHERQPLLPKGPLPETVKSETTSKNRAIIIGVVAVLAVIGVTTSTHSIQEQPQNPALTSSELDEFTPSSNTANTFVTLGDWGGATLGSYYLTDVNAVAKTMANTASLQNSQFVVNVGDSFYWCGIQDTSDTQIKSTFEDPFAYDSLQVPWYSVLGNHEYGYNVDAVVDYAKVNSNWIMDDRYYTRRVEIGTTGSYISFIFLDTNTCVSAYRSESSEGWDPCGVEFPTCSITQGDDDYEGECSFHENIISQDCTTQYTWFKEALDAVDSSDWLIVVGHHPIDELDVEDFTSLLQAYPFDLYLNGHTHTLAQYTIDHSGAYVTSGAGSLVPIDDEVEEAEEKDPLRKAKLAGGTWTTPQTKSLNVDGQVKSHSYETVFNEKVAGFNLHTFSDDLQTLTTAFVDYQGNTIHSFSSVKGQGYAA
mmetsp:Transcript_2345/g.3140  ORF Transcript_2345/g.3140 Transcript_2345/m.3140 type:complete len:427 (+) Transcript_2345:15-1295(+)